MHGVNCGHIFQRPPGFDLLLHKHLCPLLNDLLIRDLDVLCDDPEEEETINVQSSIVQKSRCCCCFCVSVLISDKNCGQILVPCHWVHRRNIKTNKTLFGTDEKT